MAEDWRKRAAEILRTYYLSFSGTQWHAFNTNTHTEQELLKVKLCYAIFGPPTEADENTTIENAYTEEQKSQTEGIIKSIMEVAKGDKKIVFKVNVGFAFVVCHQDDESNPLYCLPVFSVLTGKASDGNDKRGFVDMQSRIYKDWDDWKKYNCLAKVEIAYPENGYFSCKSGCYVFNCEEDPVIEFGKSPQCSTWATAKSVGDIVSTVTSLTSAAVGVASMFTPFAPAVLTASAIAGGASATYGAARGVGALHDKRTHGQSMKDLESLMLWFSIAATPFHFASTAVTGALARGAVQQGRIFSQGMRMFASVLLCTTFGLDTALITLSLVNLIKKSKEQEVTKLDLLQFSISVFFFSNTLIQPKTAGGVIRQAQSNHFDNVVNSMTDDKAKKTFDNFLKTNKGDGSIHDRSKIVRAINRMDDPKKFFTVASSDSSVKSMKVSNSGKTVLINNKHRVNPNEYQPRVDNAGNKPSPSIVSTKLPNEKLQSENPPDAELKEKSKNVPSSVPQNSYGRKFVELAGKTNVFIAAAHIIAERFGCETDDHFAIILEIIARKFQEMSLDDIKPILDKLKAVFIAEMQSEMDEASSIAEDEGLQFENRYQAMRHLQKFGQNFPKVVKKYGDRLEVYVDSVEKPVFERSNLCASDVLQNGDVKHTYFATDLNEIGISILNPEGKKISTVFENPGSCGELPPQDITLPADDSTNTSDKTVMEIAELVAVKLGLPVFHVIVKVKGKRKYFQDCRKLSDNEVETIKNLLVLFNGFL